MSQFRRCAASAARAVILQALLKMLCVRYLHCAESNKIPNPLEGESSGEWGEREVN